MNIMTINGAGIIDQSALNDGTTLVVRCVKNTSEKRDGKWELKPNYFSLFLRGDLKAQYEKMNPKPGSSIWAIGPFSISTYTEGEKSYLNMSITPYAFGYSTGSYGSTGLYDATIANIGLVTDPTSVSDSFGYIDGLYDVGYGENKKTERVRLCFSGPIPSMVAKGKRIDVIGRLDVVLNQSQKDGKVYANKTIYVKECNKTPFTPKKKEDADGSTTAVAQNASAAQTPMPAQAVPVQQTVDLTDFEELDSGAEFF